MRIHLTTFATNRFRHRQILLGWSALANGVVDNVAHWTPRSLLAAGFESRCPEIKLTERGAGFYAWKPFIIQKKLQEIPKGDIVFYCDVGRSFPYKLLSGSLQVFFDWMNAQQQPFMPGVKIPWNGPMSQWTKRHAFIDLGIDSPRVHSESPIQASFSIWSHTRESLDIVGEWMNLSAQRQLISDDPSVLGSPELPDFCEHRWDQALLSLVCLLRELKCLDIGREAPKIDSKHPSEVAGLLGNNSIDSNLLGKSVEMSSNIIETFERILRRRFKFGKLNLI